LNFERRGGKDTADYVPSHATTSGIALVTMVHEWMNGH
jgi:hypothetical protein